MRLFIAEKPSVAKVIAAELGSVSRGDGFFQCGSDYVTWCVGHMFEQAPPDAYLSDDVPMNRSGKNKVWRERDLPIIPTVWKTKAKADLKKQLDAIGGLLKKADTIVHAGDPDREGQLLVDVVIQHFRATQPVARYWTNAQDSVSVKRALAALKDNKDFVSWGLAALGRGRADWLIGMNLTRAFTLRAKRGGGDALLAVGRVQTPTLTLVVERDRLIEAFKPVDHFKIKGQFAHINGQFIAELDFKADQPGLDFDGRLVNRAEADALVALVKGKDGTVVEHSHTAKKDNHPKCYSLADITLAASKKFGYSADETLKICQALYDAKFTSYPRTDCPYLPESQFADAPRILAALRQNVGAPAQLLAGADPSIKSKTWDDSKVTAHHGIVPTMHIGDLSVFSPAQRNLYDLIVCSYLAQFYPAHEYMSTKIVVQAAGERFSVTGKTVTVNGWKDVYPKDEDDEKGKEPTQMLPSVKKGDAVQCTGAGVKAVKTKAPDRFTEGTLGKAMENIHSFVDDPELKKMLKDGDGIGTSATRAAIMTELKRKEFLEVKGKAIISTPLGRRLVDAVPNEVRSPILTALFERMLKEIEATGNGLEEFVRKQEEFVRQHVAAANDGVLTDFVSKGGTARPVQTGPFQMSEAQVNFLAKVEEAAGVKATDEEKQDSHLIRAFIDLHKPKLEALMKDAAPSEKQLKFAKDLAAKLPADKQPKPEVFLRAMSCKAFIDAQLKKKDSSGKGGKGGSSGSASTSRGAARPTSSKGRR